MCQEIFRMMGTMNQDSVEFQLALQCAPLITGIKISNLLMVAAENEDLVMDLVQGSGIPVFVLCGQQRKPPSSYIVKPSWKLTYLSRKYSSCSESLDTRIFLWRTYYIVFAKNIRHI